MTETEVRALVQKVLAQRGLAQGASANGPASAGSGIAVGGPLPGAGVSPVMGYRNHPSHGTFTLQVTVDGDGHTPCVIEPGVACDHCGYCRSYGH